MINAPCQNPNCKSFGTPHPNCRCYAEMAEGGEVGFCTMDRMHNKDCEYYAEGGEIDPNDVTPDAQHVSEEIDPNDVTPDEEIDQNDITPDDVGKYQTPGQKVLTGVESFAQGIAPGVSTFIEKNLPAETGIPAVVGTAQDITARQEANPGVAAAGQIAGTLTGFGTGVGEAPLLGKAVGKAVTSPIGRKLLSSFVAGAVQQGGDKIAQSLLGQHPDTSDTVGAALTGGALNAATEGLFSGIGHGLSLAGEAKLGSEANNLFQGLEDASQGLDQHMGGMYAKGIKAYKESTKMIANALGHASTIGAGYSAAGLPGAWIAEKMLYEPVTKLFQKGVSKVGNYVTPAITRVLTTGDDFKGLAGKLYSAINYANHADSGLQTINQGVNNLFKSGGQEAIDEYSKKDADKIQKYIDNDGQKQDLDQSIQNHNQPTAVPQFAEGGEVKPIRVPGEPGIVEQHHGLQEALPEHNMALMQARQRIHTYLQSKKPFKDNSNFIFDEDHEDPEQKKTYQKALKIAADPAGILRQIKNGSLESEDVAHLDAMHPEAAQLMRNNLEKRMIKAKLDGEKPPYKVRQGMSIFLNKPVSSDFTPQNIQAAQQAFMMQQPEQSQGQPQAQKKKKGTAPLSKVAGQFMTDQQARIADGQK